jgi:hypothetical protein
VSKFTREWGPGKSEKDREEREGREERRGERKTQGTCYKTRECEFRI